MRPSPGSVRERPQGGTARTAGRIYGIFPSALFRGAFTRQRVRPHRPGLHDGVRHHRAHQLRPRRDLHDRRVHGPHRGRGVDRPGTAHAVHPGHRADHRGPVLRRLRVYGGENRLQAPARRAQAGSAHLGHRHVHPAAELHHARADPGLSALPQAHPGP